MQRTDRNDRDGGDARITGGVRAKAKGRKFVAEDVVRRDLTPEEMGAPRFVNRQLEFLLKKKPQQPASPGGVLAGPRRGDARALAALVAHGHGRAPAHRGAAGRGQGGRGGREGLR